MERPTRVRAFVPVLAFLVGAASAALIQYVIAARDVRSCIQQALAAAYASPTCIEPTHYLSLDLIAGVLVAVSASLLWGRNRAADG